MQIKKIMTEKGVSLEELAKGIGIHVQSLRRIISTDHTSLSTIKAIANYLGVTEEEVRGERPNTLRLLDLDQWTVMKMITLHVPTEYGYQDVAYLIYTRPLSPTYSIAKNTEAVNPLGDYPRQKDLPHDLIDELIFDTVCRDYPKSRSYSKLICSNVDNEHISRLMEPLAEEGKISLTPFVLPEDLKMNKTYYRYELSVNLYMSFPHKNYTKYFFGTYNLKDEDYFERNFPNIVAL